MADIRTPCAVVPLDPVRLDGFEVAGLQGPFEWMDPFLTVDHFTMSQPTFRPHPHAGFSAVTVMFDDSPGSFVNRDSLGSALAIGPGDVHWAQAGSGIVHEEVPSAPPTPCHGAQIFIDLPAHLEEGPPMLRHLDAADAPVVTLDGGARVRVLSGSVGDITSPLRPATDVTLLDVRLPPGVEASVPVEARHTAFVVVLAGDGVVGPAVAEVAGAADRAIGLGAGDTVRLVAGAAGLHALICGGAPLRQPIYWHGGLAMSSPARVTAAAARYRAGEFGHLDPSF